MNSTLRHIGARLLRGAGYYAARRRVDGRRGKRLLVLMYHDILDDEARGRSLDEASPTASEFAAHIEAATRHFRVLPLSNAVGEITNGGLREDSVAITFDDGYESMYRNALPVLRRYQASATLFVLTGWIGGMTFWWHRLRALVARAPLAGVDPSSIARILDTSPAMLGERGHGGRRFRVSLAQLAENRLRDMQDARRDEVIDRLRTLLIGDSADIPIAARSLKWSQIHEMTDHHVELGAHTVSHINFRYADAQTVADEITRSRIEIAQHTESPVVGFAYPYGKDLEHYRAFEELLRGNGFDYAVTAVPGNNRTMTSPYALRRVIPPSTRSRALIDHALCHAFIRDDSFYDMRANKHR